MWKLYTEQQLCCVAMFKKQNKERESEVTLTSADVDLVQGVLGRGEHPHVRPELLGQRLDDVLRRGRARHSDALGGEVAGDPVLEVEPHHAMELQVLEEGQRKTESMISAIRDGRQRKRCRLSACGQW